MKDKSNTGAAPRSKRYASQEVGPWDGSSWETTAQPEVTYVSAEPDGTAFDAIGPPPAAFSPWPLFERLIAQWHWLLLGGCAAAVLGLLTGIALWQTRYTANAQLLRFETPNNSEYFKPRQLSEQTFASLLRSPELLRDVSAQTKPPLSPEQVASSLTVAPERNSDVVTVSITLSNPQRAIDTANLFAN